MTRVFIVHRWEGKPDNDWYPWLKSELEQQGYEVIIPEMPDTETPKMDAWVSHLAKTVGEAEDQDIFIGHSIGCQTILRFLKTQEIKASRVFLVAPWMHLNDLEDKEAEAIARPWIETPISWENIKDKANGFMAWFSNNDPWVPLSEVKLFKEKLGAVTFVENSKGHFTEEDGVTSLPQILEEL